MMESTAAAQVAANKTFFNRLVAGVLLLNLIVAGMVWFSLQKSKSDHEEQAAVTTRNISRVLDESISGTLEKVDIALQTVRDEAEHQLAGGRIHEDTLDSFIIRQHSRLPELISFRATNAAGVAIYGAKTNVVMTKSLAHRDYFTLLRDAPHTGLVISKPLLGGISGKWMVIVARRINHPDGRFAGLVYAGIGLEYLTQSFSELNVGARGSITLLDAKMCIIARYPTPKFVGAEVGQKVTTPQLVELIQAGKTAETYRAKSSLDSLERTFTFNKLSFFSPLYIVTGLAPRDYLASWRAEVVAMTLFFTFFAVVTAVSAWLFYREWNRTRDAEQAIITSEHRFRLFVENTNDLIYTLSPVGIITYVAPNVELMLGYLPGELIGRSFGELIHHKDLSECRRFLQKVMESGTKQSGLEYRICHKNGNWLWHLSNASRVTDIVTGELVFLGIGRNITDRKQMEDTLRESEEQYRILLEESTDSIFSLSAEGTYSYVNRAFAEGVGKTVVEIIGSSLWDVFPREGADRRFAALSEVFRTGKAAVLEVQIGQYYYMTTITPIKGTHGGMLSALCSARDITQLKKTEKMLREMANKLEDQQYELRQINESLEQRVSERTATLAHRTMLVEIMSETTIDGILMVDNAGQVILSNNRFGEIWGIPRDVINAKNDERILACVVPQLKHPEQFASKVDWLYAHTDETSRDEIELVGGRCLDRYSSPLIDVAGHCLGRAWFFRDVTAQRKMEQQLLQSHKLEAIGQLAGGIAHDFNNKLMVILGCVELARMDIEESAKVLGYLDDISGAADHSRQMTMQLLGFSRQQAIMPAVLVVNGYIDKTKRALSHLIGGHISTTFTPAENLWSIKIDPVQLDQIIMNMAVNARDAMPDGGVFSIETGNITVNTELCEMNIDMMPGDYVRITFSDNGIGMDEETLQRVFDPFFTTKEQGKGTGLGLATIHGIIGQNHGSIDVTSTPGKGTVFTVFFPRHDVLTEADF